MLSFLSFLTEAQQMKPNVGHEEAERHVKNYLNKEVTSSRSFTLGKKHEHLPVGSTIKVHGVKNIGGIYHAVASDKSGKKLHIPINKINKPQVGRAGRHGDEKEREHLTNLQNHIKKAKKESGMDEITIHTEHGPVKVSSAEKAASKSAKADFVLKNKAGQGVRFISHKDGSTVKDFQQFGGVSAHKDHPIVKKFQSTLQKHHPKGVSGQTVATRIDSSKPEHKNFIQKSMYGNGFGDSTFHENNVHEIHQGPMRLEPHPNGKKGHYVLKSTHVYKNGKVPSGVNMMIYARADKKRSDLGIHKTRVLVGPEASRKVSKFY